MENFENPHIDKIVGIPEEHEPAYRKYAQDSSDLYGVEKVNGEIEKTAHDIELLNFAQDSANEYIQKYGKFQQYQVPLDKIHLTKQSVPGTTSEGYHSGFMGSVMVERWSSDIQFVLIAFHELIHAKSFVAFQASTSVDPDGNNYFLPYRSGFQIVSRDGNHEYFENINEAIVSTLERKFYEEKVKLNPVFADDKKKPRFSRSREVGKLTRLINDLYSKNREQYLSSEEILNIFIQAGVTGKLLPVARLIESTYGKGSFRKKAEKDYEQKNIV